MEIMQEEEMGRMLMGGGEEREWESRRKGKVSSVCKIKEKRNEQKGINKKTHIGNKCL